MQKYIFIALIVQLAGCASYVPLSHSSTTPVLRARLEEPDVKIYLQHLENKYEHYVFDLEIDNQGSEAIYLSPQQISFYFSDQRFPRREQTEEGEQYKRLKRKQFVRKPIEVKELYEQKERSRATVATVFALVSVGMMVYDEVKDSKDRSRSHVTEKDVVRAATRDALVSIALTATDIAQKSTQQAQEDSYFLTNAIFTEGKIEACQRKHGKIFLPVGESLRYLRMVVPIENKEYIFDFKHKGTE
ncbi:MAG: hypothetical protein HOP30_12550 [Cyclobacteriaceae bacterium]|nr:hypothetical protein [Cyclobacteriaceae bacterium]